MRDMKYSNTQYFISMNRLKISIRSFQLLQQIYLKKDNFRILSLEKLYPGVVANIEFASGFLAAF